MIKTIENFPAWVKYLGITSIIGLIVLFVMLITMENQNPDSVESLKIMKEAKENATEILENESFKTAETVSNIIQTSFDDAGKTLAKDVQDPLAKKTIETNMSNAGVYLSFAIFAMIIIAVFSIKHR